jgi:sulfotransferase family protein
VPPAEVPECPDGWAAGAPDFVGVGAQRSGTTWWHRLIASHPQVCFTRGTHAKEIHFFDSLGDRARLSDEDVQRYHRYFPRPPGAGPVGEWTPRYMVDPWMAEQLAQAAPEARVLILLRDPVDRFASGFARGRRMAAERGVTDIDAALTERHTELGLYSDQVRRVLDAFPRGRVLVLQYESCRDEHDRELRRTYEYLGIDPSLVGRPRPPREARDHQLAASERMRLAEIFAPDVRRLAELVPELDVARWRSVAGLL